MRKWKLFLPLLALIASLALAAEAKAEYYQFATVRSIGGYTISNDTVKLWAYASGGRLVRGYVFVERRFHSGDVVRMTGGLTARETYDLWLACYQARPWAQREVRAQFVNVDLPDTEVTYMGRYTQRIRAGYASPPAGMPVQTDAMKDFLSAVWTRVRQVGDAKLVTYDAAGGRAGYHRVIAISQRGKITDEVSYTVQSPAATSQGHQRAGYVPPAELDALKRLVYGADFFNLQDFPGHPSWVDGIDEQVTYTRWGRDTAVLGGTSSSRTAEYQAILDKTRDLASAHAR